MPTYNKNERLCDFHLQHMLFTHGSGFFQYPFRVVYLKLESNKILGMYRGANSFAPTDSTFNHPAKCLMSVPAKRFKRAVDRNRIKRIMREVYRNNKSDFYSFLEKEGYYCLLAFIYSGNQMMSYAQMDSKINVSLQKLMEVLPNENAMENV